MANTVKVRRSATPSAVPTIAQLALGEIAVNTYDGKMFIKKDVSGTQTIVEISGGGGGTVTQAIAGDTGTDNVTLGTDTLTFVGGTGITSAVTNNTVTFDIDSTVATLTGTQTLTNKTLTSPTLTDAVTIGTTSDTSSITVGQSTVSQTTNIQAGATVSGSTKTINIGTGGLAGSTTAINIGSASSGVSTTIGGTTVLQSNVTFNGGGGVTHQIGNASQTGAITIGRSTVSNTLNLNNAITASGSTNTINIGASGAAGSTTTMTIGSANGTTIAANGAWTFANDAVFTGNLTVNGTTTTINSTTLNVDDKNIELGSVASPTNTTADGGGITLKGATDKTLNWVNATSAWTSSENIDIATSKAYSIAGTSVLSATTLGSGVTGSSLTSVGTIATGVWQGTVVGPTYGGTGVNNGSNTLTLAGNVSHAGAFTQTFTATANTSIILPTTGTLATLAGTETLTNKTLTSPTLTTPALGTPASGNFSTGTFTWPTFNQSTTGNAANVTGTVAVANGGTGATTNTAARTNLGATTVGSNFFTLTNPTAVTFPRMNADNTVSSLDAATFRTAIGAGTGSGTVTSVTATSPVASSGGTAPVISLSAGYGDTLNPYASKTANFVLAAPNGSAGVPTFRAIVAADIPTLNQNTTGNAATASTTPLVSVDNSIAYGRGGLQFVQVSGLAGDTPTTTNTPTNDWWHIIRPNHANAAGYYTDLALPMTIAGNIRYRRISAGVSSGWITVLDGTNYNSYAPTLTGTGASGSWGISVTGSSASCTGNAATATSATNVTGTVAVANGGTGVTTSTGTGSVVLSASPTFTGTIGAANLTLSGDLTVNGTTTTINSTTISVDDKNIELGSVASPTDVTADGGGITLKGATDKTINWGATNGWTSSETFNIATGKTYKINGTGVLSATTLGSGVTGSSLTSVGTIATGVWQGTTVAVPYGGTGLTSLTAGYIPFGAGTSALGSSANLVWDNTNARLGVGTASPLQKLHLRTDTTTAGSETNILIQNLTTGTTPYYVGGLFAAAYRDVRTPAYIAGIDFYRTSAAGGLASSGEIRFYTDGNGGTQAELRAAERMRLDSAGNLGIGLTSAGERLSVSGTARIAAGSGTASSLVLTGGSSNFIFQHTVSSGIAQIYNTGGNLAWGAGGTTVQMTLASSGNLGVGTASPGYKLEVNGSFAATTKSFVIDHPTKPNMKLRYGSLEGPENGVYVRGKLTGTTIELPDYWLGLVHADSITVSLTPIGKHQKLYVEDIIDNTVIVGNENLFGKTDCFYTVFAERKDVDKLEVEI